MMIKHNKMSYINEKYCWDYIIDDLMSISYYNLGLYDISLYYVNRALEYDPNLIKAKYNLALIYESNNRDKAKELYIEVLEQDPSFEEAKNALADLATSDY